MTSTENNTSRRLPSSSDEVNEILVELAREENIDVIRAKLFYIVIYIRTAERSLSSSSTTEGDLIVGNIERNLVDLLNAYGKERLFSVYSQLRELAAIAPKLRVFGINIHELREDVACYHEDRSEDDPFYAVAEAIREAAHRRLSGEVIKLINDLIAYLESDDVYTFISCRYCKATREEKDMELNAPVFERLLNAREQLKLIWNDPFSGNLATETKEGERNKETAQFLDGSIVLVKQMTDPFVSLIEELDTGEFLKSLEGTVQAIENRKFEGMEIGTTRFALNLLIFDLAGSNEEKKGRAILYLMALDCILENLSLIYYSNIVNSELAKINDDNFDRATSILPDLVLCSRATGQGTKVMRRLASEMKLRIQKRGSISRVEAQTGIKEMSEELLSYIYRLSLFVNNILKVADSTIPVEENDRLQVRLLNDMIREKTTHLCGNLMANLGNYLGGEGSPATRQLAATESHASPDKKGSEPRVSDVVFRFGPDIEKDIHDEEDVWFMGRKGTSETMMSRMVREHKLTGVDVPGGFGLCTRTWSMVSGNSAMRSALKNVIRTEVRLLEQRTGKQFCGNEDPLLLVARSGAIVSMPGILPTIGHIGLNEDIVVSWAKTLDQPVRAYHAYLRFVFNYAEVVFDDFGVNSRTIYEGFHTRRIAELCVNDVEQMKKTIDMVKKNIFELTGGLQVPDEGYEQLFTSVFSVFSAYKYEEVVRNHQEIKSIPLQYQTACLIQDCLPILNDNDSSGIYLTRNPLDGGEGQIEYINDFGEDLASGRASPGSNEKFHKFYPVQDELLKRIGVLTEKENASPMDIEFAIRDGVLHILQTRPLTLAPMADVVTAHKMYKSGVMSESELIHRTRRIVGQPLINTFMAEIEKQNNKPIAAGQPIAGGVVAGRIVFDVANVDKFPNEKVVFVTKSNVPKQAARQSEIDGYISEEGGVTSHAALVSIGKLPCVVGVKWRKFGLGIRIGNDVDLSEGDWITIDANDGYIYQGQLPILATPEGHPEYLEAEKEILEIVKTFEEFAVVPTLPIA
jgi:phosphohistidine swiveling domain-containing protein